jgi:MFS family permease
MGRYQNLAQLSYISACILVLYTAFNSSTNLQSEILDDDGYGNLGYYVLAVMYFFMGLGSIISTAVINKIGTKGCLCLGGVGNMIWIFITILPAGKQEGVFHFPGLPIGFIVFIILLAAVINGLTVGILWASANQYVADCASEQTKGFYFSYFWSFYMAS